MPNVKNRIDQHNRSRLQKPTNTPDICNCRNRNNCPLEGKCQQSGIIYQTTVIATHPAPGRTIEKEETYIGLTDTPFKIRYGNHKQSFRNNSLKNSTELSKHIWTLKENNIEHKIKWKIISKATSYNNISKRCHLCLQEKYYILKHPEKASLNQKQGLINSCRHRNKYILANHPT